MSKWDELEFLKMDLENIITGMIIRERVLSQEDCAHLDLHRRCLSVLERIQPIARESKGSEEQA